MRMKNNLDVQIEELEEKYSEMNILDHLSELRKRIIISLASVLLFTVAAYYKSTDIANLIKAPLGDIDLIYITPIEGFATSLKIAFFGGIIVASPIIFWQTLLFIAPALYKKEKVMLFSLLPVIIMLFLGGVYFSFAFILPLSLRYLMSFGGGYMQPMLSAGSYFSFAIMLIIGLGLVFEFPMVMLILSKFGIVNYKKLARRRKYIVLIIAIVSAVITPPDVVSQLGMAVPLMILFELSLGFMFIFDKVSNRKTYKRTAM